MSREEREKRFSPSAEREKILEEFEYQKKYIEEITGLTLSNLEAVGLRKITEEVMQQMAQERIEGVSGHTIASPVEEIPARFFLEFYDIPAGQFWKLFPSKLKSGDIVDKESFKPTELTKEFFRREQEKKHLI